MGICGYRWMGHEDMDEWVYEDIQYGCVYEDIKSTSTKILRVR